jgi:hypothetical protein
VAEREEDAGGLLGRDGAAALLDQLDEPVGRVERELHAASLSERMFVFKAKRKGCAAAALPVAVGRLSCP